MGTERVQNGYRMDIERISNGCGTVTDQKKGKKRSGTQTTRERILQNTSHASKLSYQSAYQRFENAKILNVRSANFCPAWRS